MVSDVFTILYNLYNLCMLQLKHFSFPPVKFCFSHCIVLIGTINDLDILLAMCLIVLLTWLSSLMYNHLYVLKEKV